MGKTDFANEVSGIEDFKVYQVEGTSSNDKNWVRVECKVNGSKYFTRFATIDVSKALEFAKRNFKTLNWQLA